MNERQGLIGWMVAGAIVISAIGNLLFGSVSPPSLNPNFFGAWAGLAPLKYLCTGGKQNSEGNGLIRLTLLKPKIDTWKDYTVTLKAELGCFAEMQLPGFIFGDEFWASSADRMTVVRLKLEKNETVSGSFRMDLDGYTLKMDFERLRK